MATSATVKGVGRFTSESARTRFLAAYDDAMALWPCPRQELQIETTYATTHVHRCGPDDGEPIVLLHGAGGSSTMWFPNIAALSANHPVYAIDTPGDPGRSVQRSPIFAPEVSARWLDEVLDGLGLTRVHLVGSSYGGWLALNQTLHSPGRIAGSTLLDPGGLEKVGARFYAWMMVNLLAGLVPRRLFPGLSTKLSNPVLDHPELKRSIILGARTYRSGRPAPLPLTDDELGAIRIPTLLLIGDRSPLIHAVPTRDRVRRLMPYADVELVTDTRHGPSIERPEYVNDRILGFVAAAQRV
ncbi:alpha/beta fold hydrolase [Streptacidiphilus fuscans]|uniref:Alpha/beta hydrolase n=1 Tax=Streptacidiphilus fuscans TaxID=2789292 RepID=A0A931B1K0_9ACTN|nr:alpha/beta hydrolase [Streptacidiphilus fuscans]MBF9067017.1 alpha/beta hydrolase [Streptacidiphilus fuscans]